MLLQAGKRFRLSLMAQVQYLFEGAVMADTKLPALTALSAPALDDVAYAVDVSDTTDDASGSSRYLTLERLLAVGLHSVSQGRLTTESGVAISTGDRTAQSTLYFTPYSGNKIALYDGTRWGFHTFTERSLSISGLTSDKNYDVFLYNNAGTLTLELSDAWTDDTTRDDALTTQDGIYVKSGATTRRYLGTIRTTGTTTIEDSTTKRFVWNVRNRVSRRLQKTESTGSWTYASTTIRQANGNSANQVAVVCGLVESLISLQVGATVGSATTAVMFAGIGEDSTTALANECAAGNYPAYVSLQVCYGVSNNTLKKTVPLGYHYYTWLEACSGASTCTGYGDDAASSLRRCGLIGDFQC
jgi:hypothetical protein